MKRPGQTVCWVWSSEGKQDAAPCDVAYAAADPAQAVMFSYVQLSPVQLAGFLHLEGPPPHEHHVEQAFFLHAAAALRLAESAALEEQNADGPAVVVLRSW